MNYKYFKTHKQFYEYLICSGLTKLDINKTVQASRFTFYTEDGKRYFNSKLPDMLKSINSLLKQPLFDEKKSVIKGTLGYLIYLVEQKEAPVKEAKEVVKEDKPEESKPVKKAAPKKAAPRKRTTKSTD